MLKFKIILTLMIIGKYQLAFAEDHCFYGHCTIKVDGVTYMDAGCQIDTWDDGFEFSGKSKYFASVDINKDGSAQGFWNGALAESHAHVELGKLYPKGDCLINDRAMLCAVKRVSKKCNYK